MKKKSVVVVLIVMLVAIVGYSLYENDRQERIELNRYSVYSKVKDAFDDYTYNDQYLDYITLELSEVSNDVKATTVHYSLDITYKNRDFDDGRLYLFPVDANNQVLEEASLVSISPDFNDGKPISVQTRRTMTLLKSNSDVNKMDINVVLVIDKKAYYIKIVDGIIDKTRK